MNRPIKIRAWEKNLKEVIPVHDIDFEKKMINANSAWRSFNEIELMQCTGLTDKNGKEIYEGDIVEEGEKIFIVNQYLDHYLLDKVKKIKYQRNNVIPLSQYYDQVNVIGNIYENPELLEVES